MNLTVTSWNKSHAMNEKFASIQLRCLIKNECEKFIQGEKKERGERGKKPGFNTHWEKFIHQFVPHFHQWTMWKKVWRSRARKNDEEQGILRHSSFRVWPIFHCRYLTLANAARCFHSNLNFHSEKFSLAHFHSRTPSLLSFSLSFKNFLFFFPKRTFPSFEFSSLL